MKQLLLLLGLPNLRLLHPCLSWCIFDSVAETQRKISFDVTPDQIFSEKSLEWGSQLLQKCCNLIG
jgi:hypothetical protein